MKDKAYAKVNFCLDVIKKRDDGYHELEMIMLPISLYDLIEIEISEKMSFESNILFLEMDEKNTIIKAVNLIKEIYQRQENFRIKVTKHIPTQAGMAGGSSNAASTIRILNRLLNLNMSKDKMIEIGKMIGADVPFCLFNKPAIVRGIGEKLNFFKSNLSIEIILVKPRKGVSTKECFNKLDFTNLEHYDCEEMQKSLEENDYTKFLQMLGNNLEGPAFELVPEIKQIKKELLEFGFDAALMSGSGSTVMGFTTDKKLIEEAKIYFKRKKYYTRDTNILK